MTALGIDDSQLRPCLLKTTYLWFRDGIEFWAYITFIGRGHTAGWRWAGGSWFHFEIDLRKIDRFMCY